MFTFVPVGGNVTDLEVHPLPFRFYETPHKIKQQYEAEVRWFLCFCLYLIFGHVISDL